MNFRQKYKWLMPLLLFTGCLLVGRVIRTHSLALVFIPWNLFLAFVPLFFSYRLLKTGNKIVAAIYLVAWLVFFPNAMYIITDLFHLKKMHHVPEWYDLLILFSAAITGVIAGYLSLHNVERYVGKIVNGKHVEFLTLSIFLLCGYGIYLGRYLRWNSWDLIADPFSLLDDIRDDVFHPFHNKECWLLTLLFGVWLHIMYKYFKKLPVDHPENHGPVAKF